MTGPKIGLRSRVRQWFVVVIGLLLVTMATVAIEPAPKELARTTWRWVHFASPTENFAVPESERYTLSFDAAGWIKLHADCNRGAGGVTFPSAGAIRVGSIALTRAMCPRGSLGDRFAQDVARVVRWSLRDGELYLELPEGSGTLQFARQS